MLTCVPPVASYESNHPTMSELIVWKIHTTHDCEHDCQDSFTLCRGCTSLPQVGDSITRRWLRISLLPNIHFLRCTARRSPQSLSQLFSARKTTTLRFHYCGSHILQRPTLVSWLGVHPLHNLCLGSHCWGWTFASNAKAISSDPR
jgi:hypothetical protein